MRCSGLLWSGLTDHVTVIEQAGLALAAFISTPQEFDSRDVEQVSDDCGFREPEELRDRGGTFPMGFKQFQQRATTGRAVLQILEVSADSSLGLSGWLSG